MCEKLFSAGRVAQLHEWQATYCPYAKRFFADREALIESYEPLGFVPDGAPLPALNSAAVDTAVLQSLALAMQQITVSPEPDEVRHCLSLPFHCLSLPFHCLFTAYP